MKNSKLVRVFISLVLCILFLAIPAGNAYAMPFKPALNCPVGTEPWCVAVGDFNKDGKPDLAVTLIHSNQVSIMLGDGSGGFSAAPGSPIGVGNNPYSVAIGDFNKDGNLDLATANQLSNNVSIMLGNGSGGFAAAPGSPIGVGTQPVYVAVGDFDKDSKLDLATANMVGGNVSILLGNGLGGFAAAPGSPILVGTQPFYVAVGDFDMNGKIDLAVANYGSGNISILLGNGSGGFVATASPIGVGTSPASITVGDFDMNGKPDLAVANFDSNNVSIMLGNGIGGFTQAGGSPIAVGTRPGSITMGDFNMDGKYDLATTGWTSSDVYILLGNGSGGFAIAPGSPISVGSFPVWVAVGDFNSDGAPDLAVSNYGGNNVSILLNTPEQPTVTTVDPASGLQGQTLAVIITGAKFAGPTAVNFGTSITVNSATVNSLTQITANISIAVDAAPGARNVTVTTPGGTATKAGGFTVIEVQQNRWIGTGAPQSSAGGGTQGISLNNPPVALPSIKVQSASLSSRAVTPGTPVTVTADLTNTSTVNGNKKVTLYVNGQVENAQGVTVNSGSSSQLTFNVSRGEPGTYAVYVDGVPAGSFKVEMFRESDIILIISVSLLAIAFLVGMVMLWRRQRTG